MKTITETVGRIKDSLLGNSEEIPAGACYYYNVCGNNSAGGTNTNNSCCDECIDRVRESNPEPQL